MAKRSVVFTEQLHKDLARIHDFVGDEAFDEFLRLLKRSVAKLTTRTGIGRPLQLERASPRVRALVRHIGQRLGTGELRELVLEEHVVLYAVTASRVFVLSLRNQREDGFHFG